MEVSAIPKKPWLTDPFRDAWVCRSKEGRGGEGRREAGEGTHRNKVRGARSGHDAFGCVDGVGCGWVLSLFRG